MGRDCCLLNWLDAQHNGPAGLPATLFTIAVPRHIAEIHTKTPTEKFVYSCRMSIISKSPLLQRGKAMTAKTETVRPEILLLVELGNGVGQTKVSASSRAEIRKNLRKAFNTSKERSASHATS